MLNIASEFAAVIAENVTKFAHVFMAILYVDAKEIHQFYYLERDYFNKYYFIIIVIIIN